MFDLVYRKPNHATLPHVVRFSGGRSSAMMLLKLLPFLDPSRGDVIIFNNTSAEHLATYEFVVKVKSLVSNIPFFFTEFATYEALYGVYKGKKPGYIIRRPSFRLVNQKPYNKDFNPFGYRTHGEVFEELLSFKNFLPSPRSRICTTNLKVLPTDWFLKPWLKGQKSTKALGLKEESLEDLKESYQRHLSHGGKDSFEIFKFRKAFIKNCPGRIPSQKFEDFSHKPLRDFSNKPFISFYGLRADEPMRVVKLLNYEAINYMPLADWGITKPKVLEFWNSQTFNLRLPSVKADLGNCVFCFMKGSKKINEILQNYDQTNQKLPKELRPQANSPQEHSWWKLMEQKYSRNGKGFGGGGFMAPCHCTD